MIHEEFEELIYSYADRALGPEQDRQLQAHLAECAQCAALLGQVQCLQRALAELPLEPAPAELASVVGARIRGLWAGQGSARQASELTLPRLLPWQRWALGAAAVCVLVALSLGLQPLAAVGAAALNEARSMATDITRAGSEKLERVPEVLSDPGLVQSEVQAVSEAPAHLLAQARAAAPQVVAKSRPLLESLLAVMIPILGLSWLRVVLNGKLRPPWR